MSRMTAWVIMVTAGVLVYSLAFTTYEASAGSWTVTDSGGLVKVTVKCPPPISDLALGVEPERDEDEEVCERSARTLMFEAGFVALGAVLLTWAAVTRSRPDPLHPLSSVLNRERDAPDPEREETQDGSGREGRRR